MKIHKVEQKTADWFQLRKGKITGTGLKKIVGTKLVRDNYLYEILAERLSVDDGQEESALERGERLESEAIEAFEKHTGKIVDRIGFIECDDSEFIGCSPDGLILNNGLYDEAVEVKCLSSANHIKALIEDGVPKDYYPQIIQSFIVNTDLKKLYFVLYDPRITLKPFHVMEVSREMVAKDIEEYKKAEIDFIKQVDDHIDNIVEV